MAGVVGAAGGAGCRHILLAATEEGAVRAECLAEGGVPAAGHVLPDHVTTTALMLVLVV